MDSTYEFELNQQAPVLDLGPEASDDRAEGIVQLLGALGLLDLAVDMGDEAVVEVQRGIQVGRS